MKDNFKKAPFSAQIDLSKFSMQDFEKATDEEKRQQDVMGESTTFFKDGMRRLRKNPLAMLAIGILVALIIVIIFAPLVIPYGYADIMKGSANLHPFEYSASELKQIAKGESVFPHICGTDSLGRDYFIRVIYGARVSLVVGIFASILVLMIGMLYGSISGYLGGRVDLVMMRIVDIIYSLPDMLLIILLAVVLNETLGSIIKGTIFAKLGTNMIALFIVFGLLYWVGMARLIRGQILTIKQNEYVLAAKCIGTSTSRTILKHILPNCLSVIIITTALQIPSAIFTESYLSFVGLGVSAPMPSLGSLANEARSGMMTYPERLLFPAFAICLIVLALNLLGDGLRDAFDPKLSRYEVKKMEDYKYILELQDLHTTFTTDNGDVSAVNGVNFTLEPGKTLGIVGESGSGKSVTAYSIMQILADNGSISGGKVLYKGENIVDWDAKQMAGFRGRCVSIIFQDPMTSLNPVFSIGYQLKEAILLHTNKTKEQANERAKELLSLVGINEPEKRLKQYPHELSGGMRQRVMIAMALACEPDILIADEPTTALDVTIQAQILELMQDLQKKLGMAIIMVTHDLGVIASMCDEIIVMYGGRVCERGTADDIFYSPSHEYTKGLLRSIPTKSNSKERLVPIGGTPINLLNMPEGCAFCPRCDEAMKICLKEKPEEIRVGETHMASCWMNIKNMKQEEVVNE